MDTNIGLCISDSNLSNAKTTKMTKHKSTQRHIIIRFKTPYREIIPLDLFPADCQLNANLTDRRTDRNTFIGNNTITMNYPELKHIKLMTYTNYDQQIARIHIAITN